LSPSECYNRCASSWNKLRTRCGARCIQYRRNDSLLDFNDTWLAAEGGHPSDNLGGILATAGNLSRLAIANDGKAITIEDVLIDLIKALEIQGCISLEIL
jgi:hypothetical protein